MAIYKDISSKVIINKVMRDLKPVNNNWVDDAIEWIGEALEHIGAASQLTTKKCVLSINEYKSCLPKDFFNTIMVATNTSVSQATQNELNEIVKKQQEIEENLATLPNADKYINKALFDINTQLRILEARYWQSVDNLVTLEYGGSPFIPGDTLIASDVTSNHTGNWSKPMTFEDYNTNNSKETISKECDDCVESFDRNWYIIENGLVKTSFKKGNLCMAYKAFPLDDDCYPMVPDDVSYREAMFWYIYKQMLLGGYDKPTNKIDYNFADEKWKYYCTQARNSANYPDIDRYENFLNQWVRLIPNINRHNDGTFKDLAKRENLYREGL